MLLATDDKKLQAFQLYKQALETEKRGEYNNAISLLKNSIGINPEFYQALNRLGLVYSKIEEREKAIHYFKETARLNPDEKSFYNLAVEYYKIGETDLSFKILKTCLEYNSKHVDSHLLMAHILRKQDKTEESIRQLFQILSIEPKNRSALGALIILYFDSGKLNECIQLAERYLKIFPKDTRIALIQSDALLKAGNQKESLQILKKLTSEDQSFTSFTNSLAQKKDLPSQKEFFTHLSQKTEKKINEYEAKLELYQENPEDFAPPDAQDAMDVSLLYLFNGETEKALEYMMIARKSVEAE